MARTRRRNPKHSMVWPMLFVLVAVLIIGYLALPHRDKQISRDSYASGASFVSWFEDGHDDEGWYRSDFDNVDHFMQVGWAEDHILFDDVGMSLKISDRDSPTNGYTAGEYQRRGRYGFGRYEVVMRAPEGSGLVTSFFTHTGPYFGDPHDEIDFEILGKDTTRIYLNWFTNGKEGTPLWHELGFDAAKDFHLYAFEWEPGAIRWYVDGQLVYERAQGTTPVPQVPGRIIANLWTGSRGQYKWHGEPTFSPPVQAAYRCMSFRRLDDAQTKGCADAWRSQFKPSGTRESNRNVSVTQTK